MVSPLRFDPSGGNATNESQSGPATPPPAPHPGVGVPPPGLSAANMPPPPPRFLPPDACKVCGRVPTVTVTLRRHVGLVLAQQFVWWNGPLCREHGLAMANSFLRKTLVQGWWGLISFFMNWLAIVTDVNAIRRFRKLPPPS